MESININPILEKIYGVVLKARVGPGMYSRIAGMENPCANAYGCADAANILYTLNRFPQEQAEREAHIKAIQSFQEESGGIFLDETHSDIHTTAHCTAALELFDAAPRYPFYALEKYREPAQLYTIFEEADFLHCGKAAHNGAGVYAAFVNTKSADAAWKESYFAYLDAQCDAKTGLWVAEPAAPYYTVYFQIGDAFHYLFNYENAKRAFPYPDRLIDSCLAAYENGDMGEDFEKKFHFIQMDWVYCLNRASRQTAHRFDTVKRTLWEFAKKYTEFLMSEQSANALYADDLHMIFGTLCCMTELQQALPGKIQSDVPLRLVLDRRPFI